MSDEYVTVAGEGHASFKDRGSEFVGYVAPASHEDDAKGYVENVRDEHADATHHVSAYRVRDDGAVRGIYDDDGEPSGSAGKPVLEVLRGEEVENVVAVVVRYYGGTKLGYGGLVSAYSETAKRALNDAGTRVDVPRTELRVEVEYDDSGTARDVLESEGVPFDAAYEESVVFTVRPPAG
ncbi:MAG: IMPACT family protein, partial [Halobacteriales archaeon]